jgi:glycosyltransferase involved in cell wall biosynthesis
MKQGLSVIMIAKNEAGVIERALVSAVKVADEIIVVDTGSTDNTKEIARSFDAKVFDFPWINDFAAARNESLRHASYSWVMWLDCDDYIPTTEIPKINRFKKQKPAGEVYSFFLKSVNRAKVSYLGNETITQCKFFPNDPRLEFRGRIHEQITQSAYENGYIQISADITIEHTGYSNPATVRRKLERNLSLVLIEAGFPPDTNFVIFNIQEYNCFYAPDVLAIFQDNFYIGSCDPFDVECPGTNEEKRILMIERALVIIKRWETVRASMPKTTVEQAVNELDDLNRRIDAIIKGMPQ